MVNTKKLANFISFPSIRISTPFSKINRPKSKIFSFWAQFTTYLKNSQICSYWPPFTPNNTKIECQLSILKSGTIPFSSTLVNLSVLIPNPNEICQKNLLSISYRLIIDDWYKMLFCWLGLITKLHIAEVEAQGSALLSFLTTD